MAEPPAKRARRTDSLAIMDQNKNAPRTEVPRQPSSRKDASKSDNKDRRHRSRSRSRTERRRDRSAETKPHSRASPSAKERRDGRDRNRRPRERSHSRDRQKSRRGMRPPSPTAITICPPLPLPPTHKHSRRSSAQPLPPPRELTQITAQGPPSAAQPVARTPPWPSQQRRRPSQVERRWGDIIEGGAGARGEVGGVERRGEVGDGDGDRWRGARGRRG